MVVDDDPVVLTALEIWLEGAGHSVITRDSALGTSRLILAENPDYVILDIGMPGLGGDALAQLLRKNPKTQNTAIIFYTNMAEDELADLIRDSHALGVIPKTGDEDEFLGQLRIIMGARGVANNPIS